MNEVFLISCAVFLDRELTPMSLGHCSKKKKRKKSLGIKFGPTEINHLHIEFV